MIDLKQGDCLQIMQDLPDASIDAVITDPPYGTTACAWDSVIPFEPLWKQIHRITKINAPILLFGSEPFSSWLRISNIENYKYDLYWKKEKPTNFFQLKRRFGKVTENICVFYKSQCTYNPQKYVVNHRVKNKPKGIHKSILTGKSNKKVQPYVDDGTRYPIDILEFNRVPLGKQLVNTQKPIALIEFLVKTFTNENDVVLDFAFGSGTTAVACRNTRRNFKGIEINENHYAIAKNRLKNSDYIW